jgi:hypothetical protein
MILELTHKRAVLKMVLHKRLFSFNYRTHQLQLLAFERWLGEGNPRIHIGILI